MTEAHEDVLCCDDDWSIWMRFETWIWAFLLIIQLSMVAFLVVHGRRDKSFRQAFYVFFVAVTLVDCGLVFLRPSREGGETIFGTVYDEPSTREEGTTRTVMNQITQHVVVPTFGHAQPLFLTAIAVNRFTAFAFPVKHSSMWRTRTVVVTIISLAMLSVLLGAICPAVVAIRQATKCSHAAGKQGWKSRCNLSNWAFEQMIIPTALITFTSAFCCVVSFVLNVGSVTMLIVLRTTGRLQRKGPELPLFAHSFWMFLLQLLLAFEDVVFFADSPDIMAVDLEIWDSGLIVDWAGFRHSSEWLAGVNATRKWVKGELAFTPGCMVAEGYWDGEDVLPMCSAWYLLLIGEFRFRENPDFSVRTVEQCLFALSGSVFLLIVSGNVRRAYFAFYFQWQCFKRKRALHSK